MEPAPFLIDTGGPDDNVPLEQLDVDADVRYRPSAELIAAVRRAGYSCLDRPIVPLLNALREREVDTLESCAGGMLFVAGVERRTTAAVNMLARRWAQRRWSVWVERDDPARLARTELWWSRRCPNWGGYMGTDSDWRWRSGVRTRAAVDGFLLTQAERVRTAHLPAPGRSSVVGAWLDALVERLVGGHTGVTEAEWFEVVVSSDVDGWSATARREIETVGCVAAPTLALLRRAVDAAPERLLEGEGITGFPELRAALKAATGGERWSKLDEHQRRAMIAAYSTRPSEHAAAGPPASGGPPQQEP